MNTDGSREFSSMSNMSEVFVFVRIQSHHSFCPWGVPLNLTGKE